LAAIFLMGWHNIRPQLGEYETLQPGGVFSGSAAFLFESHINDLHRVKDLKLVVTDYHGNKSSYPIAIQEEWFKPLNDGFAVINRAFTTTKGKAIQWN
jgi:hypothetical protein